MPPKARTKKPERRGRGDGTLLEREPGVWRLRVFAGKDPLTGKPRQVSRTFKGTRTDALKALRAFASEIDAGHHKGTNETLGTLLDRWPAQLELMGRRRITVEGYRSLIDRHLIPAVGKIELRKLTAFDLDGYYRAQTKAGLAPGTVRMHHAIMTGALQQAVRWGWITTNPARHATPPAPTKSQRRPPSSDGVKKLIEAAAEDIDLATAVVLAAITGARRGELCGLQWHDVDWEGGTLLIERSRTPVRGGDRTGPTKSEEPRRVSIGVDGLRILRGYSAAIDIRASALGVPRDDGQGRAPGKWGDQGGWLLSYDCGRRPMRVKGLTAAITALGKRAGVPVTTHALRHYAATEMVGAGIDVTTAAGRLGHTPAMLLSVYAHVMPTRDAAAAKMLEGAILGSSGLVDQ